MRILEPVVFFGSGPVAAKSLQLLVQDFRIEAVVTKPRATHHKGDVPVLAQAEKINLPIYTASTRNELTILFKNRPFKSRIGILIDFGIIVSQDVIDYFELGIVNSHFSLLPEWRGADPITFSILSGQKQTGISLMLLTAGMDEGPLLSWTTYPLSPDITTPELTDHLINLSWSALCATLPKYVAGDVRPQPQDAHIPPTYSRKLSKKDGVIDWQKPAQQIEREIRAFIEWPKSRTVLGGREVIITKAHVTASTSLRTNPGDVNIIKGTGTITVTTGEGLLQVERLKPIGKREMSAREFLAGNPI